MAKYKGVIREIYEYEKDIDAEDSAEAISKLKEFYADDSGDNDGIFLADACSYIRAEFSLRKGRPKTKEEIYD